jgi:hypothetical protein
VPGTLSSGKYQLEIKTIVDSQTVFDASDSSFSIISSTEPGPIVYGAPEMAYPVDGQTLNYGAEYLFKVKPISGASGYQFRFYQNDVLIYDNQRDLGRLSADGEFGLFSGDRGYSLFKPGNVKVAVRALVNNAWSQERVIIITLAERVSGVPDLLPTSIIYTMSATGIKAQDQVLFDSGIQNRGGIGTGNFDIKWFVDNAQVGYGSHFGIPANTVVMDGNSQYAWTATQGEHKIVFFVDADNHVTESDETNNIVSVTVTVQAAALSQGSLKVISPNGGESWQKGST